MHRLISAQSLACHLTRRELLRVGSLGAVGLSLGKLLAAESQPATGRRIADSCILVFLEGGPSHIDLWDMKPQAPAEVRGEFRPIASSLPGVPVCEHLSQVSRVLHHFALVRSVHHKVVDHNAGAYYMLTGRSPTEGGRLLINDQPDNFPPFGAVLAKVRPTQATLPPFVHLPDVMSNNGFDLPGQRAGFLGAGFDPLVAGDPSAPGYRLPGLTLGRDVTNQRLLHRRSLLDDLNRVSLPADRDPAIEKLESHQAKAFELLSSSAARNAFDLEKESASIRERYGLPDRTDRSIEARKFGGLPHLGQCMLLARRLVESGVRLVTVASGRRFDQAWDTHRDHFPLLKKALLPYFDQALSALIQDLHERDLLKRTLVVVMGEFGRTPKLGQITSSAGAAPAGRDHWPHCYTVMLAGGGIHGGAVYGSSDRFGAYPASDPVTPEDIAATIYQALGIDPATRIHDHLGRPHSVAPGSVIRQILA